ncbi:GMC family oxidoreductase N-terminal domain-containing protein [Streptomyces sp. NPDC048606]|uniref:GMC family oxidoreductase n=1 Tax=Streptomyces sp. NPDC048606 TaxID=3154726 RepID=UPI003436F320
MYDYVIVGGGSAGAVLAARLSEDPQVKVCLVEAGPVDSAEQIHVPAAFAKLFRTRLDWDYDTHDEPHLNRRRLYLPRGRVLGGTSSINTQIYIRGNRADYDAWDQPGWSYAELLPYFKRSEDNERGADAYHATGGPLAVSDGRAENPMSTAFVEAAVEAGYTANDDFNGASQEGFGAFQLNQRDGRRASTATAFLHPVLDRPNLTVETNLQVHRVVIEDGRATGVVGHRLDELITLRAEREVVLSAGTYNSPQLLQLSGIGPAALLGALGIPVVLDQPLVGQNLQDHVLIPLVYPHEHPISMLAAGTPENFQRFLSEGRGPLTSNGPEVGGFVRTDASLDAPDVEYLAAPVMFTDGGLGVPTAHAFTFGPSLLTPRSRGSVGLASEDPTAKPRIQHNYFADEADLDTAVAALRIALDIADQKALRPYTATPYLPPASASDADLRAYALRVTHSIFHPTSTCAIGSVVDAELKVLGIEGLRVVDASVMPNVVRGNTNAPTIAIAEKAADLIRGRRAPADTARTDAAAA